MVSQLRVAAIGLYFICLFSGLCHSWLGPVSDPEQHALIQDPANTMCRNFSVGFSLESSYGAAAVIFTDSSGRVETHTTIVDGGPLYREVMGRLSLESSRHPAPPYESDGEYWADWPRQWQRAGLRAAGLPSSYEVGVLANVVRQLRSQLEHAYHIDITEAVFTSSHLLALYQDDLHDIATHLKLRYVTPRRIHLPIVWETAAAYAGHGRGLCKTWWNDTECMYEELREMPDVHLLSVHYSRNALTAAMSIIAGAGNLFEPEYRHAENFTLGRDALSDYRHEEDYWRDLRQHLLGLLEEFPFPFFARPELVMVTGDAVDGGFLRCLVEVLVEYMGIVPDMLFDEPTVVAAKGAAEFMRRGPASWSD